MRKRTGKARPPLKLIQGGVPEKDDMGLPIPAHAVNWIDLPDVPAFIVGMIVDSVMHWPDVAFISRDHAFTTSGFDIIVSNGHTYRLEVREIAPTLTRKDEV